MPRLSINYANTIIYKIVCKNILITDVYVGHTTNFTNRKRQHKAKSNTDKSTLNLYIQINLNGGFNNWDMIMIEEYPCNNLLEARQRERYWYETLNATLNSVIPYTTKEEGKITTYNQQHTWYEINKTRVLVLRKNNYENNKEKIKIQRKNYYENNKEELKILHKNWYEKNKERLSVKIICECGVKLQYRRKLAHLKKPSHITYLASLK
jgi:hypothetical protein